MIESFLMTDMPEGNKFIESIVPSEDDKFIDNRDENIVKSEDIGPTVEDTEVEEQASNINSEKNKELSQNVFSFTAESQLFMAIKCYRCDDRKAQYSRKNIVYPEELGKNIEEDNICECRHSSNYEKSEELVFLEEVFDEFHKQFATLYR